MTAAILPVCKMQFHKREPLSSPPTAFHVGMHLSWVHEPPLFLRPGSGFQAWLLLRAFNGNALQEKTCGTLEYIYIRNGILVGSLGVTVGLIRRPSCDYKHAGRYFEMEEFLRTVLLHDSRKKPQRRDFLYKIRKNNMPATCSLSL